MDGALRSVVESFGAFEHHGRHVCAESARRAFSREPADARNSFDRSARSIRHGLWPGRARGLLSDGNIDDSDVQIKWMEVVHGLWQGKGRPSMG